MPEPLVYKPADRPDIEAEIDGTWYPGELRMWRRLDDGRWVGDVRYSIVVAENRLDTFPEDRIRQAKSFENTTSSATGWLHVACIATTLRHQAR